MNSDRILTQICMSLEWVEHANGSRRERTLDPVEVVVSAIANQEPCDGYDAGRVANAYKYAAWTTNVIVRRYRGRNYLRVRESSAKGGTGRGDFIRGSGWIGPNSVDGLRTSGFVALPTVAELQSEELLVVADRMEDNGDTNDVFRVVKSQQPQYA